MIGKWNIEDDGNSNDGCLGIRSVDENKSMNEKSDT